MKEKFRKEITDIRVPDDDMSGWIQILMEMKIDEFRPVPVKITSCYFISCLRF